MNYFVYVLKSVSPKPVTYVGYTNNLKKESSYIMRVRGLNLLGEENGLWFIKKNINLKKRQFLENII